MKALKNIFVGMLIGIGAISPGVSGGALAMIFGVYQELVNAVGNLFKDIKKNLTYLIPIGIGVGVSVVILSGILKSLFESYPMQTSFTFAGLITGTLPILFKHANKKGFNKLNIIPFVATFAFAIFLSILDTGFDTSNMPTEIDLNVVNIFLLAFYGFVLAGSLVIPGISGSVLLSMMGAYFIVLNAMKKLNPLVSANAEFIHSISVLIPMGIGLALGVLIFSKLMDFLLKKHYSITYYAILGFVIGSVSEFVQDFQGGATGIISIVGFVLGLVLSYGLSRFEKD